MAKKGVEFASPCLIYEVCNPLQAKRVLERNMRISTALPCRISVYQTEAGTELATILPTYMLEQFGSPDLKSVAQEVEETMIQMIEEAAQ
jgi:uncharacterized protein (DUF302 family)